MGRHDRASMTKGALTIAYSCLCLSRPMFLGASAMSMGCSRRVSMVQNSSSPLGSATPDDERTAARQTEVEQARHFSVQHTQGWG